MQELKELDEGMSRISTAVSKTIKKIVISNGYCQCPEPDYEWINNDHYYEDELIKEEIKVDKKCGRMAMFQGDE